MAWHVIAASEIHRRTNLKPRGYAGDAEMMRLIYENGWVGRTLFGRILHKYAVELEGAEAVRSRRRLVPRVLREVAARFPPSAGGFRFLSLASGPAWELQDIYLGPADAERLACVLLDQDPHALEAARHVLAGLQEERHLPVRARFVTDSVRTMLRSRDLAERFGGRFHFIYSMGLFDYLTPPVARAVLARAHDLLEPGGTLLVGNYHLGHPSRIYMDYWLDWPLYCRTEEGFRALAAELPAASLEITYDDSRAQMFLRLEKPA
jgi:extracellular factor (EF) 3-hydroxypalmitic acid methyl ester biosynthesis protein